MITIDGYPLDLVETEEHVMSSEVTEHPVEDGADISDNIRNKPRELTFTNAVVSNTPIGAIAEDDSRIMGDTLPPPSQDAYRRLEKIWESREVVTVVSSLKKYENMALDQLTVTQEAKNAGGLIFTAHFIQVTIRQNKRVTMAIPNAGGETNLGLSLDRLVNGKKILWRKGRPPGTSPSTVPVGVIYATEVVTFQLDKAGNPAKLKHANGKELTTEELEAFTKDVNRDTAIMTNRGLYRAEQAIDAEGTVIDRALNMSDYKDAHPGEKVSPSAFGLEQDPRGRWRAR